MLRYICLSVLFINSIFAFSNKNIVYNFKEILKPNTEHLERLKLYYNRTNLTLVKT